MKQKAMKIIERKYPRYLKATCDYGECLKHPRSFVVVTFEKSKIAIEWMILLKNFFGTLYFGKRKNKIIILSCKKHTNYLMGLLKDKGSILFELM